MKPRVEEELGDAVVYLGSAKDDARGLKEEIIARLFDLGILYIKPDGSTDLTAFGESVYADLIEGDDVPGLS